MSEHRVEIVSYETGEVVKEFKPVSSERRAEKLDNGVNINLNHEKYFTRIVEVVGGVVVVGEEKEITDE